MGIILNFIGRRIARAAARAVETVVITGAVLGAAAVAAGAAVAADEVKEKRKAKQLALIGPYPVFQIFMPEESNRKQRKICKTLEPYFEELNTGAEELYKKLDLLYKKKIQLLECFVQYADILNEIEGLPESPSIKIRYKIKTPSFQELCNYIKRCSQTFENDDSLKIHIAKRGFIKCHKKDSESMLRLFSLENELSVVNVDEVDNVKSVVRETEKLGENYDTAYQYVVEYCNKLQTCYERFQKVIRKFKGSFKKTKRYDKLSKLTSSSYISTVLILDLINTNLVEKDGVNEEELDEKMNRRMI